jgi:peptidoglycan/LPS O-acetylase OafA/YrhL
MNAFVTAGAGFLMAVLWFDLMFDVQALRSREGILPEGVLASIAGYYRRVTREARRMNKLVALVMAATLAAVVVQIAKGDDPAWVGWVSLVLVVSAVWLAAAHTFKAGARLGARRDPPEVQSAIARSILRDHLLCLPAIVAVLVIQLAFA